MHNYSDIIEPISYHNHASPFPPRTPKHYLVTGGCGFIGSHVVDALIERGDSVVIVDDLSTGKRENANPQAKVVIGSTTDYALLEHAARGIDGCFHLAAVASVEKSIHEWASTHSVNATSTVNIFQASSRAKTKFPVVYTSSAAVYGNALTFPINEECMPCPLTAYGADKLSCDLHARVAWHVHQVPNIGLRPFNVYGPRQDPSSPYSGVISIFMDKMQRGVPVTIYGDGEQIRDFVYVKDAVKAFVAAMDYLHAASTGHEVINLCTGRSTSISALADTIAAVAERSLPRHYAAARQGDIRISIGDPARLEKKLGLKLNVTLEEGLRTMLSSEGTGWPALPLAVPEYASAATLLRQHKSL